MNFLAVLVAGLVGTFVITMVMNMAPKMGMPEMDIVGMLGSMFGKPNRTLGLVIHYMMGIVFTYVYLFFGLASLTTALLYGAVHWLVVGLMMGVMPMMHAGMKSGDVPAPGLFAMNNGGMKSFVGGLMGHLIFAVVVFYTYSFF